MSTRREFLGLTAAGLAVTSAQSSGGALGVKHQGGVRIKSVIRRDETTVRLKDHHGSFHMTWAADDRQYITLNDGLGCCEDSHVYYNNHLLALGGGPQDATFHDVPGYPKKSMWDLSPHGGKPASPWYNAWGILALDNYIYQFVSSFNHPFTRADGSSWPEVRFVGAKLIYSPDNGRTWHNQDGSTPVVWESFEQRSSRTMLFVDEPQGAFCLLSILQMGRSYQANRDGYIYVYGPNGNSIGAMNELVMFRVPRGRLLQRNAYEFFAGRRSNGDATWVKDISARRPVHTFPQGWIGTGAAVIPFGWFPSVVYNAPLGLYMMVNWGQGWAPDATWFGKPSYLGFWTAPQPWGPWTQIHEETAWTPLGDREARAYQPQIVPKWIAPDGKSFWLAWDDYRTVDQDAHRQYQEEYKRINALTPGDERRLAALLRKAQPFYGFNMQRVDLVLG